MNISKKIAALAVAGAIVASGALVATSAQAAPLAGATLTITPLSGNVNTDTVFLNSLDINVAAPTGFQASGGTFVYQGGVEMGNISIARNAGMASTNGTSGLDGSLTHLDRVINPTNNFLSSKLLNQLTTPLVTGTFELRSYYFASATSPNRATDPYAALTLTYNATTGAWGVPVALTPTTTSLTAGATGTTVNLQATVKNAANATVPTTANVVFKEGTTVVGTSAAVAGVAALTLTGVSNGSHTYTAEYAGDATYSASVSGTASVGVGLLGPVTVNPDGTSVSLAPNVIVSVAKGANGGTLSLSGVTSVVDLGAVVLNTTTGTLDASGTLKAVVTDTRSLGDYPIWNLSGAVSDFKTAPGVNQRTLLGKYLGWTPAIDAGTTATGSLPGAVVAPAPTTSTGISTAALLTYGQPDPAGTITNAKATLLLKAPSNTSAGNYTATLTLTLI